MSMRYLGGFISASYNPFMVPNAPTIGTATAGDTSASVSFTAPTNVGGSAITSYVVVASTGQTATNGASPITVTGLTNGVAVTFQVTAINIYGSSALSVPSNSVIPSSAKLFSWGINADGELGQNDIISRSSPVQVGALTNWSDIKGGNVHTIAIKKDGTLWTLGGNGYGQLGQNTAGVSRSSPVQVGALTTWSKISSGNLHSLATKIDGTLWLWGNNNYGQLGQNNRNDLSSPTQVGAGTTWSDIAGCQNLTIATKTDGTLWLWGFNAYGQLGQNNRTNRSSPVQVGSLTTWSKVAGSFHTLSIKTDGTLWSWGRNTVGQLGQNDVDARSSPVQVGALTTWLSIKTGDYHTLATRTDGSLWSWGKNNGGQLGQSNRTYKSSPTQVGSLTTWLSAVGGKYHTVATKTDGSLWAWGYNAEGSLGQNNIISRSSPVQVGSGTTWLNIASGAYHSLAISS